MVAFVFLIGFLSALEPIPSNVFRAWDGEWEGEFIIYDANGGQRVIETRHHYRSRDDTFQDVEIVDRMPDGTTIRKRAENVLEGGRLFCRVYFEDGRLEVEHHGVFQDGHILWSSRDEQGRIRQVFRERVQDDVYFIDGFGIYGPDREVVEIYVGRYRRVGQ